MQVWKRGASTAVSLAALALLVAACSPTSRTNTANLNVVGQAPMAQPVQSSSVQTNSLPPLGGATGTPAPGLSGQPVLGGASATTTTTTAMNTPMGGSTTSLPPLSGSGSSTTTLGASAGGVSSGPEGTWNVAAGAQSCSLNLPLTAKTGTNYYRASAPGCAVPQIASVTGWQQVGSQLQLYDDNGNIAAFLAPSSGRYIGTMSGGQAVSMSR